MKPTALVGLILSILAAVAFVGVPVASAMPATTVWSGPTNLVAGVEAYSSVSCTAEVGPCFAVDTSANVVEDPSNTIGNASLSSFAVDPGGHLSAISCPARVDTQNDFCMAVDDAGNAFSYFGSVSSDGTLGAAWQGPTVADPAAPLTSVACTTQGITSPTVADTVCVAVDADGNAVTFNNGSWSAPTAIDPGGALASVSCADDAVSCVAVDNLGQAFTYDGASWATSSVDPGNALSSVTCPAATLCVAVDNAGNAMSFDGTAWSAPLAIDPGQGLASVSCQAADYCAAVDGRGDVVMRNAAATSAYPAGWTGPMQLDPGGSLVSVSCDNDFFCDAVDGRGDSFTFAGPDAFNGSTGWGAGTSDAGLYLSQVSCPSTTFCLALDNQGHSFTYDGSTWSGPTAVDPGGDYSPAGHHSLRVSCASASFCAAVNNSGEAFTFDGSSWSAGVSFDPGGAPTSVSCTSATFCAAVDVQGNAFTYDGSSWTESSFSALLRSVTCASPTFCMAADGSQQTLVYNGTSWSPANGPASVDLVGNPAPLDSLSCPTAGFCAAVNAFGEAFTYNGSSWSASQTELGAETLSAVVCSSPTFCAALGSDGVATGVVTFDGRSWSDPTDVQPVAGLVAPDRLASVSCPLTNECAALDRDGSAFTSRDTPSLIITPSPLPATTGAVTYTVSLAGSESVPTGSVALADDHGGSCSVSSLDAGSGSCAMTESAGSSPYVVTATYSGDTNFAGTAVSVSVAGSVSASGVANAITNGVRSTASGGTDGTDVVTVATYPADPVADPTFQAAGKYFSVALSSGNTFGRDVLNDCDLNAGRALKWWNASANSGAGAWSPVVGDPGPTFASSCISVTLDNTTSPPLAQLSGTVFGVADAVPGAPSAVSALTGSGNATVKWTAPANNGGSAITGYVVTPYIGTTASPSRTFNSAVTSDLVTGLAPAKTYTFKVAAKNAVGTGPSSPASPAIVVGAPAAPTSVTALSGTATATTGSLTVSYFPGVNNGAAITKFTATCTSTSGGVTKTGVHNGASSGTITVAGVTTKKTYSCTVTATNARGTGLPSPATAAVIVGVPARPTNVHAVKSATGSLKVSFTPGANNGAGVTGYTATCSSTNSGVTKSKAGPASPLTVIGLTAGKTYTCTVKATNSRGTGPPSGQSTAVTA